MHAKSVEALKRTELFAQLGDAELRRIARLLRERRLSANQALFRQGDAADSLYIVVSGRLRVSAMDRAGREKVLAFIGRGELVGEMGVLSGEPRSATAVASTDVELLQLRKGDFDALVTTNVDLMRDLARSVVQRREATQQRAVEEASAGGGHNQGLVTTVFSPRGGAGTTTIATNVAIALAQRAPDRVILLDLNVPFGHVPVMLNLRPRTSLAAISAVSLRQMDRENLEFYLTTHRESSIRVLSATLRPEEGEMVTADHVTAAIDVLQRHFVHIIVDLSRSFSDVNLAAIEGSHNLMIVCTPERVAARGVAETQRIIRQLVRPPGDPMQYVVNQPSPYAPLSANELEDALHIRLLESIPFGGDAPVRAALEGQPLVTRWPNSATSRAILQLADRLEQQLAEARLLAPTAFLTVS